jgi:peptidoglycan/LPS O-acetylase OafA/YrhL
MAGMSRHGSYYAAPYRATEGSRYADPTAGHRLARREPFSRKSAVTSTLETSEGALSGERLPALDGVRGVAILLVMLFHFSALVPSGGTFLERSIYRFTGTGWAGVDLFFVLSGFLITGILYDSRATVRSYFRNFYARRALRIFPVYYAFLVAIIVLIPFVAHDQRFASDAIAHRFFWYATYLTNVKLLDHAPLNTSEFILAGHLWSLAVEEQFYLIWPALVLLFARRQLLAICGGLIVWGFALRLVMDVAGAGRYVTYEIMPARIDTLAVGAFIALAFREPRDFAVLRRWAWPIALPSALAVVVLYSITPDVSAYDFWVQCVGFSALALLFGAVVLSAMIATAGTLAHRIYTIGALRWLGKYSYALYLFHWPVAAMLSRRTDIPDSMPSLLGSELPGALLFFAAAGAISLSAAWLSWQVWESQFLKLKRLFPYVSGAVTASAAPASVGLEGS